MKILENVLFIEHLEMQQAAIKSDTINKAVLRGTFKSIADPADGRKVLIEFESLKDEYKQKVVAVFGNPYDYVAKEPIKKLVVKDFKASQFFFDFAVDAADATKKIPEGTQAKYTNEASWLNMLLNARDNTATVVKKGLGLKVDQFYTHVGELLRIEAAAGRVSTNFPTSYVKLTIKMAVYKKEGYGCLVDKRFGNKSAAKVTDEMSEGVLLEMLSQSNQFNDVQVQIAYNKWAAENNYEPIAESTVRLHRQNNLYRIMAERNGNAAWYNTFGKIIHRKRPSAPLLLIGSDDNDLDLYFIEQGKKGTNFYFRHVLIVVMDAFNDYILGYSYGDTVTIDLIKAAYLDAAYHIRELTGGWYLPHQLQTDRWAIDKNLTGDLATFYQSIGTYIPATLKVARAKYIEQAFGNRWHDSLRMYSNYAGHNITAKKHINPDAIQLNKSSFPKKDEAHRYIADHIERMRSVVNDKGIPRQQAWIESFNASELSQEKQISDARMLTIFGRAHKRHNTITNGGLRVEINGDERIYDVPEEAYLRLVGKTVQVMYEPYNRTRVLVTDGDKLRFIAHEVNKVASAIADYAPGERALINYQFEQKRNHVLTIGADSKARKERIGINASSLLQAGILTKETRQKALAEYRSGEEQAKATDETERLANWEQKQTALLDEKIDISTYL